MSQLHLQEYIFIRELISSNFAMHMYENDYTHTHTHTQTTERERERENIKQQFKHVQVLKLLFQIFTHVGFVSRPN